MKKIYFTPGPSELYPSVPKHLQKSLQLQIGSISHRSVQFQEIYQTLVEDLKKLLEIPQDYHVFIVGSGTEAMERIIQNCVETYSLHFVNGSFAKRFFMIAAELGKKPALIEVPMGEGFDLQKVTVPKETELICFTQNETSSGVALPVSDIENIAKKYPDKLIAVDIVSSAPYVALNYKLLDIVFFSVQKGFGLPAGLGVMIVSPRAIKKAETLAQKKVNIGSYHSFTTLMHYAKKQQTHETPPVLHMYLLGKVIKDMRKIGIAAIRRETEQKAQLLYDFIDQHDKLFAYVQKKHWRSQTVIVVSVEKIEKDIKKLLAKKGFIIGSGYGANKKTHVRIANFPAHKVQDVKRLIKELKAL